MPSEIDAPALHGRPLVCSHSTAPVRAFRANIVPEKERLQPNTTSLAALTAASERLPSGSFVVHSTAPVRRSSAAQPPAVVTLPSFSVHGIAPIPPPLVEGPLLAAAT